MIRLQSKKQSTPSLLNGNNKPVQSSGKVVKTSELKKLFKEVKEVYLLLYSWIKYKIKYGNWQIGSKPFRWAIPVGWILGITALVHPDVSAFMPPAFQLTTAFVVSVVACWRIKEWYADVVYDYALHRPIQAIRFQDFSDIRHKKNEMLIGAAGFTLTNENAQRFESIIAYHQRIIDARKDGEWGRWPGMTEVLTVGGDQFRPIRLTMDDLSMHTLLVGASGSGKTKLLEVMIAEAILDGGTCIVIDNKDDFDLADRMYDCCARLGRENDFYVLAPFNQGSHTYNPLRTFRTPDDVANRIMALLPSGESDAYFAAVSEMVAKWVIRAIILSGEVPTFRRVLSVIIHERTRENLLKKLQKEHLTDQVTRDFSALCQRNQEGIDKISSNLQVVLSSLTAGFLDPILSPESSETPRDPDIEWPNIFAKQGVIYISSGSMSNDSVGASLAQIIVKDLLEYIGAWYKDKQLNPETAPKLNGTIIIDEAGQSANETLAKVLGTVRGAGVRMVVAMQTLADMEFVMGKPGLEKMTASSYNKIIMRTGDSMTPAYLLDLLPEVTLAKISEGDDIMVNAEKTTSGVPFDHKFKKSYATERKPCFDKKILGQFPTGVGMVFVAGKATMFQVPLLPDVKYRYPITRHQDAMLI